MRILGLVLVTSLAVGYLAHTPARATACDATTAGTASRAADLPIYYGGTLAPIVVEGQRQAAGTAKVSSRLAPDVQRGVLN